MNLSAIAIKRPVLTTMVTLFLMVLGFMGLSKLGTERFPDVSFPVVVVTVAYPGASPGEVETLVTKPMEDAIVTVNGVDRLRSESREGIATIILFCKLEVDVKQAAIEVREKVAQARFKLPQEVKEPNISRFDVGAVPVLTYTLAGGGRSLAQTQQFAKDVIKPALEQIEGVGSVNVRGGADREIKVNLDLAKIDGLRLSPLAIIQSLRAQNLNVPAGRFDEGKNEVSVRTLGEFKSVEDIRQAIVASAADGSSVRLADVANVEDGLQELRTRIRVKGESAVTFDVVKQSGTNTVAVSDAVKEKMLAIEKGFEPGLKTALIIDEAKYIKENAHEVIVAIFFGGGMAILVILIFLLDLRSTIISAIALPTSVITTFFIMNVLGFSLNMMSLLALSLAIGLLIDDAVVVRENISKHLERGADPMTAAQEGTKEIALSVLATTLTIVAVFVPVSFMSGIVGQFFRQFGLTITAATLVSLFIAFTVDPMLSSRFSRVHRPGAIDPWLWLKRPFLAMFAWMEATYRSVLNWAVHHKTVVLLLALFSFVGGCGTVPLMGFSFVNQEDRSQFVVDIEFPSGTKLEETARRTLASENAIQSNPNIVTIFSTLGFQGEVNKVHLRVVATPKVDRKIHINIIKEEARKVLAANLVDAAITITDPPFVEGGASEAPIMVMVRGNELKELEETAHKFELAMRAIPGMQDIKMKYNPGAPELRVTVDRDKAARMGVPVATIAMGLRAAIEGDEAGKLRQGKDETPIRVRLGESDRASATDMLRMTVQTPQGPVALGDIANVDQGDGPSVISREGRQRQIILWATPTSRPLTDLAADMKKSFDAIKMPAGGSYAFDGQIKQMGESNNAFLYAIILAIVLIYLVLASQFESFVHPITIMATLPLALVGALLAHFQFLDDPLAMGAIIGIILLMGLVTKNAILLLDRAIVRVRDEGESPLQAVLEAGPERLRPILMTSAAMVLGMLPTATSRGEGSEFRAPMAIAVIGGVISSTLLSLVVVPVVYLVVERLRTWVLKRFGITSVVAPKPAIEPDTQPAE
jgi:hydrophobic/amphiphilic exporter-1 (mainly G- bacteria), HAE1 family